MHSLKFQAQHHGSSSPPGAYLGLSTHVNNPLALFPCCLQSVLGVHSCLFRVRGGTVLHGMGEGSRQRAVPHKRLVQLSYVSCTPHKLVSHGHADYRDCQLRQEHAQGTDYMGRLSILPTTIRFETMMLPSPGQLERQHPLDYYHPLPDVC